jgi:hypothetical protein
MTNIGSSASSHDNLKFVYIHHFDKIRLINMMNLGMTTI